MARLRAQARQDAPRLSDCLSIYRGSLVKSLLHSCRSGALCARVSSDLRACGLGARPLPSPSFTLSISLTHSCAASFIRRPPSSVPALRMLMIPVVTGRRLSAVEGRRMERLGGPQDPDYAGWNAADRPFPLAR